MKIVVNEVIVNTLVFGNAYKVFDWFSVLALKLM